MRDSMIFYRSFAEAIECLDEEDQLAAFWNIINYALDGEEPSGSGAAAAVFKMAKPQIDTNAKRYENGTKGGRPKPNHNQTVTKQEPNHNQTVTKPEPNVNVNDNDNVNANDNANVNVNENKKENVLTDIREKSPQEQAFDAFWEMYPKKKSKGQAKKAWDKLKPDGETIKAIMEKLPELIASKDWKKEDGRYIPYPATWLNAEGWKDETFRPEDRYEEVDRWAQAISQY